MTLIIGVLLFTTGVMAQDWDQDQKVLTGLFQGIDINQDVAKSEILSKVISIKMNNATVLSALQEIADQAELGLVYNAVNVDAADHKLIVDLENVSVNQALWEVLKGTGFRFAVSSHGQLIIMKNSDYEGIFDQEEEYQQTVTGQVIDAQTGEALPGVNVTLEGSPEIGTTTNINGEFVLTLTDLQETIVISYIGYDSKVVYLDGRTELNIELSQDVQVLDDVVVIGYASVSQRDLTGSVSSVSTEEITSFANTTTAQALQGRIPGVHVVSNTGAPGAHTQVRIRGTNSIMGSNAPLWIIDGFPGDPNMINTSDIQSIDILKDASATAIYGSRGASGVIIVTTNRGEAGKTRVSYEQTYGVQTIRNKLDLLDAEEYARFYNIQQLNDQGAEFFSQSDIAGFGSGTDWQDLIFRSAPILNHTLRVNGGTDDTQFSINGTYFDQEGIIVNSDYRRISLVANLNHKVSERFSINSNVILSRSDNRTQNWGGGNRGGSLIAAITSAPPTATPYNENGNYTLLTTQYPFSSNAMLNPKAVTEEISNEWKSNRVNANIGLLFAPVESLSINITGNARNADNRTDDYTRSTYPGSSGSAGISTSNHFVYNLDSIVNYNRSIGNNHTINVTTGFTFEKSRSESLGASGTGFQSDIYETYNLAAAANHNTPGTGFSEWVLMSYLARVNYSYQDKYMATFSFRTDGSSRYSEGEKWGYFPSGALAYRVSEADFMRDFDQISDFKLRVSYGESGSAGIGPYQTLDMLSVGNVVFGGDMYPFFAPGLQFPGNLRWETTKQLDIGADISLFDYKLSITADYYIKNTYDLLNTVQLPRSTGYINTVRNVGEMQNRGFEFQVDYSAIQTPTLQWNISTNFSLNRNEIVKLYDGQDIPGTNFFLGITGDYVNLLREEHPFGAFYGYETDGFTEDGQFTYKSDEKTFIGDPNPDFVFGINSDLSYRNFDLNIFVQGSYGNDIYSFSMLNQTIDYGFGLNTLREVLENHWTPDNPNARYPKISRNTSTRMSDQYLYDGSYIRLKNIRLGYNIPVVWLNINWFSAGQIYLSGQNLITLTSYPWFDPEVNSVGGDSSINQGIDYYTYPTAKTINLGVKIEF